MDKENRIQIRQILTVIKISSLVFPAIAFLQYYSKTTDFTMSAGYSLLVISILLAILFIYSLWMLMQSRTRKSTPLQKLFDPFISMSIALASVLLTGAYESNYKFLFIFVILFTSIECSRKISLTVSILSSAIILMMDLILYHGAKVNTYFECDIVLASVFMIISWMVSYYDDIRRKHIAYLRDLVNIDGLTDLYNHRYFHDYLARQVAIGRRDGTPVSLLFIDIDNFKYYNDIYGHQRGDGVLRTIATLMKKVLPENAFIARYGGEEFAAIFPFMDEAQAIEEAEKLRVAVQEYPFDGQESLPGGNLTISLGVSSFPSKAKSDSELIKGADDACYRAKFLCKNRVEAYFSILDEFKFGSEIITQIKTLIAVINAKDKYTYRHVERVVFYCNMLADEVRLSEDERRNLIYSAYLHDIGKINISEDILTKTEPLTSEEWATLKNHPQFAVDIIKNNAEFDEIRPIILQHHECFNGTGYPDRLKGEQIHPLARLLTVVDAFDAMTSLRPYQKTRTYAEAVEELNRCSGTQFDPEAVKAFTHCIETRNRFGGDRIDPLSACGFGTPPINY